MRIFQNKEVDRPALKLWGAVPGRKIHNPLYEPVTRLAFDTSDLFGQMGAEFHPYYGRLEREYIREFDEPCEIPHWRNVRTVMRTPLGELTSLRRVSTVGEPGYVLEYFIKEPADVRKLLSAPYEPYPFDPKEYLDMDAAVGDRGIALLGLPHPGLQIAVACGSETFALLTMDEPELLDEAVALYAARSYSLLEDIISHGLKPVYGIIGPEILTPPLLNMDGFRRYEVAPTRKLYERIHESGGYVWMHCHGKVANLLDDFIEIGVDVLNPLEPPKNGDVDMFEVAKKYGSRIGLEGNIEIQDILLASPDELRKLMEECVTAAASTGRFILCPSAGYEEYVYPTEHYLNNLMLYLTYGLELVTGYGK
jgi:hypothetical protein